MWLLLPVCKGEIWNAVAVEGKDKVTCKLSLIKHSFDH